MAAGYYRQEITIGSIIGTWRILKRAGRRISRGSTLKYEYLYEAECIHCGFKATKRTYSMRTHESHMSCPARKGYKRETAIKGDYKKEQ